MRTTPRPTPTSSCPRLLGARKLRSEQRREASPDLREVHGSRQARPNPTGGSFPKLANDGLRGFDWADSAELFETRVRAVNGWPTRLRGPGREGRADGISGHDLLRQFGTQGLQTPLKLENGELVETARLHADLQVQLRQRKGQLRVGRLGRRRRSQRRPGTDRRRVVGAERSGQRCLEQHVRLRSSHRLDRALAHELLGDQRCGREPRGTSRAATCCRSNPRRVLDPSARTSWRVHRGGVRQ